MNPKLKEMQLKLKRLLNDVNETLNSIAKLVGEETDLQRWSKRPKIRCIQQTVAEFFNVEASVMQSKLRTQAFVWPRFAAMLLSREMTKYGTAEIAEEFGKRDHSGIIYGSKEAVSRELTDKEFRPKNETEVTGRVEIADPRERLESLLGGVASRSGTPRVDPEPEPEGR